MQFIGQYAIPFLIALTGLFILLSKKDLFNEFLKGGRDGFITSIKILPSLVMLITAVSMFSASGALDIVCRLLSGITNLFHVPKDLIPIILMRPISGSATNAMLIHLLETSGPDSFSGRAASIIMGSSDTIIYTLAMYFSAAGIKKTRHAMPASFLILGFCVLLSGILTKLFFYT